MFLVPRIIQFDSAKVILKRGNAKSHKLRTLIQGHKGYYSILIKGKEAIYVILPYIVPISLFVLLVQWYQRYMVPPWLEQNTTDPLVSFGWAISEHCSPTQTGRSSIRILDRILTRTGSETLFDVSASLPAWFHETNSDTCS